jgi:hypothetical protein
MAAATLTSKGQESVAGSDADDCFKRSVDVRHLPNIAPRRAAPGERAVKRALRRQTLSRRRRQLG